MTWLAQLPSGARAVVSALPRHHGLSKRLIALGLTPGSEVQVLQNRRHGPLIIEVHGARLALGRRQATWVAVEPVSPSESEKITAVTVPREPVEER